MPFARFTQQTDRLDNKGSAARHLMPIRATLTLASLLALSGIPAARSQGVLVGAGSSWSYHFTSLNYVSTQTGTVSFIHAGFTFSATDQTPSAQPHSALSTVLYEGQPSIGQLYSHDWFVVSSPQWVGFSFPAWEDLEGSVTISVTSGSYSIDSCTFTVYRPNSATPPSYDIFETTVTPVPEPSPISLFAAFAVLLLCFRIIGRKSQPNHPAAGQAGSGPRLTIQHHWPGLPVPGRSPCLRAQRASGASRRWPWLADSPSQMGGPCPGLFSGIPGGVGANRHRATCSEATSHSRRTIAPRPPPFGRRFHVHASARRWLA